MCYSRAKELINKEFGQEGLDPTKFGIHSLLSGGDCAAAALGVPDRLFQRNGGWRSEKAWNNTYIHTYIRLYYFPKVFSVKYVTTMNKIQ